MPAPWTEGTPRIAFVVLAHSDAPVLVRLIRLLHGAGCGVVVHVDAKADAQLFGQLKGAVADLPEVRLVEDRVPCTWGGFSLVRATLKSLRLLMATVDFDYVFLLSGTHYPTAALGTLARDPRLAAGQVLIESSPALVDGTLAQGLDRVHTIYPIEGNSRIARLLSGAHRRLRGRGILRRRGVDSVPVGVGSQWWALPRGFLDWLFESSRLRRYVKLFGHSWVPDEMFFQTAVGESPWAGRIAPDPRTTFMRWNGGSGPEVLTAADYHDCVRSGLPFVRKVSSLSSAALLDRLDGYLEAS